MKNRGVDAAQKSQLTAQTDLRKGKQSRQLVESIQIEKRFHRGPVFAAADTTWSPKPVKKPTKDDFLKLIETINVNEKEVKRPERKMRVTRYGTTFDPSLLKDDEEEKDVIIGAPVCTVPIEIDKRIPRPSQMGFQPGLRRTL